MLGVQVGLGKSTPKVLERVGTLFSPHGVVDTQGAIDERAGGEVATVQIVKHCADGAPEDHAKLGDPLGGHIDLVVGRSGIIACSEQRAR
ncbi:MAG: hypothetical protein ACIAQU_12250, partial [Phycisphaerales bacterium JB064]